MTKFHADDYVQFLKMITPQNMHDNIKQLQRFNVGEVRVSVCDVLARDGTGKEGGCEGQGTNLSACPPESDPCFCVHLYRTVLCSMGCTISVSSLLAGPLVALSSSTCRRRT